MRTPVADAVADALRGLAAAGVLLSAVVHLDLYLAGFSDIATIGPLFLTNAVGGLALALTVLVWRHWLPALLAAGFGAVTVAAYWVSVVHGLFGVREGTHGWPQTTAASAEYAAVVFGLGAVAALRRRAA